MIQQGKVRAPGPAPTAAVSQAPKNRTSWKPQRVKRARTPSDEARLDRFTRKVKQIVNSLLEQRFIQPADASATVPMPEFALRGGGFAFSRPPTVNDDILIGASVGSVFVNTATVLTPIVYVCSSNTVGAAVWTQVSGGVTSVNGSAGAVTITPTTLGSNLNLAASFTDATNSGATETDLYATTLAAGQYAADGDMVEALYVGNTATTAAGKTLRVYFGGTVVSTLALGSLGSNIPWIVQVTTVRQSSSVVRVGVLNYQQAMTSGLVDFADVTGLTLTNTQVLKITGEATATNDIVARLGYLKYGKAT